MYAFQQLLNGHSIALSTVLIYFLGRGKCQDMEHCSHTINTTKFSFIKIQIRWHMEQTLQEGIQQNTRGIYIWDLQSIKRVIKHAGNLHTCPPGIKLSTIAPTKDFCRTLLLWCFFLKCGSGHCKCAVKSFNQK